MEDSAAVMMKLVNASNAIKGIEDLEG